MSDYPETDTDIDLDPEPCLYWVGVYLADRAYGGREEGGWYYDCGTLVTDAGFFAARLDLLPRAFTSLPDAHAFANTVQAWLDAPPDGANVGRRPKSSVLSEGVYEALVMEETLPSHFPTTRPHYE